MSKCFLAVASFAYILGLPSPGSAQDNPILRQRLQQMIAEELCEHNSEATAWYHYKRRDKQKWTEGKLLGKPIRLASWSEESKTWLWLEDPASTLHLQLTRLAIAGGRVEFSMQAVARARFKAWGRIPKLAKGAVGGSVLARFAIDGSAAIGPGTLVESKITRLEGRLDDLRFNNDLAHPFEDLTKDALNDYVRDKNEKLCKSLEKAINKVHF